MVTSEINKLKIWFDLNKLSLNLDKTKFMLFGNRKTDTQVKVMINNVKIERVYENTFLGVILDHKICWKPHIKYVRTKVAQSIGVMGKARHVLSKKALFILYCSLVMPYLNYCVEVWGNTYKTTLQTLSTIQKRAIRIVNKVGYHEHTNLLYLKLHTLKFNDLVKFKTAQLIYKAINKQLPGNIQQLFTNRVGGYNLRGDLNLSQHRTRTKLKSMCISICGVLLWNGLSSSIKQSVNMLQFKKRYKSFIFDKYRSGEDE